MMHHTLRVGDECTYKTFEPGNVTRINRCRVVGTWAFAPSWGRSTREERPGRSPATDSTAHGYLLVPTGGGKHIYAVFGDVAIGRLSLCRPGSHHGLGG